MELRARRLVKAIGLTVLLSGLHPAGGQPKPARFDEWPGLWGPNRDARVAVSLAVAADTRFKEVWRRPIGKGVSEIAVVGDRGFTMLTDGEVDHLVAIDLMTGKETWRTRMEATYRGHGGSQDGPISTPVVDSGKIFALNPFGKLFAFDAATGRDLWKRDLKVDLGAVAPFWGFASSPLPVGKNVVVQTGGAEHNNLVALDSATGKTVWSAQPSGETGYSSPVLMTLGGVPQIVAATTDKVFGVRPEDGSVLWVHPSVGEPRQSPVPLSEDRLLVMSWFESTVLKVTAVGGAWKVQEVWKKPVFKSNYSPVLYYQGYLYGMNGMFLTCVIPETGEVKWSERVYNGSLILVGHHLALIGERSGEFHLIEATPDGYREKLKTRVFTPGALSLTGPMFFRNNFLLRNSEEVVMVELAKGETGHS